MFIIECFYYLSTIEIGILKISGGVFFSNDFDANKKCQRHVFYSNLILFFLYYWHLKFEIVNEHIRCPKNDESKMIRHT